MFQQVICGVESSPASLVAVAQAARLVQPGGRLVLAAVANVAVAAHAGMLASDVWVEVEEEAQAALAAARREAPSAQSRFLEGRPAHVLVDTAREGADLVAVGTHGGSRTKGILLGSVATLLLHEAPCSVLIARASEDAASFPRSICVGVDGSVSSVQGAEIGRALAKRFGADLSIVAACGGMKLNLDDLFSVEPNAILDHRSPVEALVARAEETSADLLIVGSRGLHGISALGSVSERVAHEARCSVLVVREKGAQRN